MGDAPRRRGRPSKVAQHEIIVDDVRYVYTCNKDASRNQWQVKFRLEGSGKWLDCYIKNGQTDDEDTIAQQMREKLEKVANASASAPAPTAAPSPLHARAPEERTAAELYNISPSEVGARHQCNRPTREERDRTTKRLKLEDAKRRVTFEESGAVALFEGLTADQLGWLADKLEVAPEKIKMLAAARGSTEFCSLSSSQADELVGVLLRAAIDPARAPRSRGCSMSSHSTPRAPARSSGRPGTLRRLPGPIGPRGRRSGDVGPPFLLQAHGA